MEGIMICETAWDEPPEEVVFKGHNDWPTYVPERTCHKKWTAGCYGFCSECGCNITGDWAVFCPNCGARVEVTA